MRRLALVPLFVLGACSAQADTDTTQAETPEPTTLAAGQWETSTEVTQLTPMDKGKPRIATPAGTKASAMSCVSDAEVAKPAPALLIGTKDKCEYKNFYMARGRLNASLSCTRHGLDGPLMVTVEGTYTATGIDATSRIETYFASDGDVRIAQKIAGKKVGACPADKAA